MACLYLGKNGSKREGDSRARSILKNKESRGTDSELLLQETTSLGANVSGPKLTSSVTYDTRTIPSTSNSLQGVYSRRDWIRAILYFVCFVLAHNCNRYWCNYLELNEIDSSQDYQNVQFRSRSLREWVTPSFRAIRLFTWIESRCLVCKLFSLRRVSLRWVS